MKNSNWRYSLNEANEAQGLLRADIVLATQDADAAAFSKISKTRIAVLPHLEPSKHSTRTVYKVRAIGFIGSDNPVNVASINAFAQAYAILRCAPIPPTLLIAGSVCPKVTKVAPGIVLLGQVTNPDELYNAVDLMVVPLLFGGGANTKMVEAISYGLPVISTSTASRGLPTDHPLLTLESIESVVKAVIEISKPGNLGRLLELQNHVRRLFETYEQNAKKCVQNVFGTSGMPLSVVSTGPVSDRRQALPNEKGQADRQRLLKAHAPPLERSGKRVLFIGHGYHLKTGSSAFFIEFLKSLYDVSYHWISPHLADPNYPRAHLGHYDIAIFWQIMPDQRIVQYLDAKHIVCIPMFDSAEVYESEAFDPCHWQAFSQYSFISFCRRLHRQFKSIGLKSFYLQYAPNPSGIEATASNNAEKAPSSLFLSQS